MVIDLEIPKIASALVYISRLVVLSQIPKKRHPFHPLALNVPTTKTELQSYYERIYGVRSRMPRLEN
jgi:hypothetical protein